MAYGCHEERYPLPIAAVDTHRSKPSKKSSVNSPTGQHTPKGTCAGTSRDYFGSALATSLAHSVIKEEISPDRVEAAEGVVAAKD